MDTHSQAGWHRADIIAGLRKRGTNLCRLGLANDFAASTLSASLIKRHPRANLLIADVLGVSPAEIWPDWYGRRRPFVPSSHGKGARRTRPESSPKREGART